MPSTYTTNNGIELIATGEQSGTWGITTNTNLQLLDASLDGQVTITLSSAGSSGSPNDLPVTNGSASNGRNRVVIFNDGGDLGATAYVQLTPNDAEKIVYIRNSLSGSRDIVVFQGTYNASNDYVVPNGTTAVVFFDGAGTGAVAANVFNNAAFDALQLGTSDVSVNKILDQDDMSGNDASALATQQSIKAYVDSQVGTVDTLAEVLANGNTTGGTDIAVGTGDDITFADSSKAIFGAGSDLQIYHDGSNSYINDTSGTGNLYLASNQLIINNAANTENMARFAENGAATLYYDGSAKIATASSGIDVTGSVVSDGLTVDASTAVVQASNAGGTTSFEISNTNGVSTANNKSALYLSATGAEANAARIESDFTGTVATNHAQDLKFYYVGAGSSPILGQKIANNGDVSIYADDGSTPAFYWDASTSRLGLGETNPAGALHIHGGSYGEQFISSSNSAMRFVSTGGVNYIQSGTATSSSSAADLIFTNVGGSGETMRIDSSGLVGIGASSPSTYDSRANNLVVGDSGDAGITIFSGASNVARLQFAPSGDTGLNNGLIGYDNANDKMSFATAGSDRMHIDSSGNVGVKQASPGSYYAKDLVVGAGSAEEGITIRGSSSGRSYLMFADGTSGNEQYRGYLSYNHADDALEFATGASERMSITSAGAINVNGDSINAQTSAAYYIRNRVNGGSLNLGVETSAGALYYPITMSGTSNVTIFNNATTEIARFLSNGNFGIGTDSATTILEIQDANAQLTIDSELSQFSRVVHQHNGTSVWTTGTRSASDYHIFRESGSGNVIVDAGNVGINASSPSDPLTIGDGTASSTGLGIKSTNTGNNYIHFGDTDSNSAGRILYDHNADNLQFNTGGTLRGYFSSGGMTITANNGSSSHLFTYNENGGEIQLYNAAGQIGTLIDQVNTATRVLELIDGSTFQIGMGSSNATGIIEFRSAGFGLAGVIDANANWLFGKSGSAFGTAGTELLADGAVTITRSGSAGGTPFFINRLSNDGELAAFYKDGTQVGSIGSTSGVVTHIILDPRSSFKGAGIIGGSASATEGVINSTDKTGATQDGTISLGTSGSRWKDIYLSNAAYLDKVIGHDDTNTYISFIGSDVTQFVQGGAESMRLTAAGDLLVGATTAYARLHVKEAANKSETDAHVAIEGLGYSAYHWLDANAYYIGQNSTIRAVRIYSGTETAGVALTNGSTSWGTFSDERLKYDVEPINNALQSLSELRTIKYRLKDVDEPDSQKKLGVVAQDLVGVLDEVVEPLQRNGDDTEYMAVRYTELVPVLIKAVQEQQDIIENLKSRIEQLEGAN